MIIYTHAKGFYLSSKREAGQRQRQLLSADVTVHTAARRSDPPSRACAATTWSSKPLPCSVAPVENGSFGKARHNELRQFKRIGSSCTPTHHPQHIARD